MEGSARIVLEECTTNLKYYQPTETALTSVEPLQVCLNLVSRFQFERMVTLTPGAELTNPAIQQNLRSQISDLNSSQYQSKIALFNLVVKTCLNYNSLRPDLARLVFTFGMGFPRSG